MFVLINVLSYALCMLYIFMLKQVIILSICKRLIIYVDYLHVDYVVERISDDETAHSFSDLAENSCQRKNNSSNLHEHLIVIRKIEL